MNETGPGADAIIGAAPAGLPRNRLINGDRLAVTEYPYVWSYASAVFHIPAFSQGR